MSASRRREKPTPTQTSGSCGQCWPFGALFVIFSGARCSRLVQGETIALPFRGAPLASWNVAWGRAMAPAEAG